jgi:hypothetical protein
MVIGATIRQSGSDSASAAATRRTALPSSKNFPRLRPHDSEIRLPRATERDRSAVSERVFVGEARMPFLTTIKIGVSMITFIQRWSLDKRKK